MAYSFRIPSSVWRGHTGHLPVLRPRVFRLVKPFPLQSRYNNHRNPPRTVRSLFFLGLPCLIFLQKRLRIRHRFLHPRIHRSTEAAPVPYLLRAGNPPDALRQSEMRCTAYSEPFEGLKSSSLKKYLSRASLRQPNTGWKSAECFNAPWGQAAVALDLLIFSPAWQGRSR